jgi:hypothetical protein
MPTVYVTQESLGKNLEPAKKFGSIRVLLRHDETSGRCDYSHIFQRLSKELRDFDPSQDFLLNVGEPHAVGLAYSLVLDQSKGQFSLLKWIRRTQEYVASEVDVDW